MGGLRRPSRRGRPARSRVVLMRMVEFAGNSSLGTVIFDKGSYRPGAALLAIAIRSIATERHVETEVLCPRIHRKRPADRAGRRDRDSDLYRRPGRRPVRPFWQFRWTAATRT